VPIGKLGIPVSELNPEEKFGVHASEQVGICGFWEIIKLDPYLTLL
jgi:hypothetical protein